MSQVQRKNKLRKLLENSYEKYYWLGFLLADGHFSKDGRLSCTLSIKDESHIKKLASFLNVKYTTYNDFVRVSVMDVNTVSELMTRYNILPNKTYSPPDLSLISSEFLLPLRIGFIDGDGSIRYQTGRKDCPLTIKCHSSWRETLENLFKIPVRINNRGYSLLSITDNTALRKLKQEAMSLHLPVLIRKWGLIDENMVSKQETARLWHREALELKALGASIADISSKLNKKYTTVYNALNRKEVVSE